MGRNLAQFAQVARAFIASVKTIWLDACVKSSKSEKVEHLVQKGFKKPHTRTSWADTQVLFIQARLCRGLNNIYIYIYMCVQRVGSCYILCRIYIYIYHILWMDQMLHHCDSYTVYRRLSQGFLVPTGAVFHPSTGCLYEWRMFATLCRHTRTYPSMCIYIYIYIYMFVC